MFPSVPSINDSPLFDEAFENLMLTYDRYLGCDEKAHPALHQLTFAAYNEARVALLNTINSHTLNQVVTKLGH